MLPTIDSSSAIPLYKQIVEGFAAAVARGELAVGERLPPERQLAESLRVSRTTVVNAYREMQARGLIISHVGRGTFIAASEPSTQALPWRQRLSQASQFLVNPVIHELGRSSVDANLISFAEGLPDHRLAPADAFQRAVERVLHRQGRLPFARTPAEGHSLLREAIVDYVRPSGLRTTVEQVLVVDGAQQGVDLVCRTFLDPGDVVITEGPTFMVALQAFRAARATVVPVPLDADGMRVELIEDLVIRYRPKLIYVVPTFQNPSGTTLTVERRRVLLDIAARYQIPVIEDDPYREIFYDGSPPPPLAALDDHGVTVYIGTFSKVMYPGIGLGWVIAPRPVIESLTLAKWVSDLYTNSLMQWAMAEFLGTHSLRGHLDRIRGEYRRRRDAMLDALVRYAVPVQVNKPRGGFYLWGRLAGRAPARVLLMEALREGVAFVTGEAFYLSGGDQELRLCFSTVAPDMIEQGVKRLAAAARHLQETKPDESRLVTMPVV